ncbi:mannanase [uncultured Brevundimonas sp.]|uniref:glycoside hydrolase 5 family protein n=1 Tax=uncultured Brevundimonas sp. TaxID=213418 RepID=UPI0025926AA8|nr:mannanase [uncultured Brevundimonas sp.]
MKTTPSTGFNLTRRSVLASSAALTLAPSAVAHAAPAAGFVTRDGIALKLDGKPYRFVGANAWYLAWLGADADYGDQGRLSRELDALAADGVTNLRVGASAELSPLKNSVRPAFRDQTATYNETLLVGLDRTLVEMASRRMKAVLYLTNFWEWSGGMMTYLSWVNGGRYINMNDPAHPWPEFADFNADFYRSEEAVALYHDYVRAVVGRTNTISGVRYADDPTIMAWQLANEPRAGGGPEVALGNLPAFYAWINGTARLIKSIAPRQLVSTGGEGLKGSSERAEVVIESCSSPDIDYLTAHIWPGNWGWLDREDMAGTDARARALAIDYVKQHIGFARQLGKPLVIEEFGYPRDGDLYDPSVPTTLRDGFYADIHAAVLADARAGGPLVGSNFWAWNGEGRTRNPDFRFHDGDSAWLGDPPHEPQGWYGVFDTDLSTRTLIRKQARDLSDL